jgi:hypothetical protein
VDLCIIEGAMAGLVHVDVPRSREQLLSAFARVHAQATDVWEQCPAARFFAPAADGGWSPARNVTHLVDSLSAVTRALRLPRLVPRLLFGVARQPSRSFEEVVLTYRNALAGGAGAGRYTPVEVSAGIDPVATRAKLLARWHAALPALSAAIVRWDDAALDRIRLPHPILGKLTVREMLYFSLYHLAHHANVVAERQQVAS